MDCFMPEWLIALAVTLFVLDLFLMTEVLSWFGVTALSAWLTWRIGAHWYWAILIYLGSFTLFAFGYVFLLRNTLGKIVRNWMQGRAPKEAVLNLVGAYGNVRIIDGKTFVYCCDELWPVVDEGLPLSNNMRVVVTDNQSGQLRVKIANN